MSVYVEHELMGRVQTAGVSSRPPFHVWWNFRVALFRLERIYWPSSEELRQPIRGTLKGPTRPRLVVWLVKLTRFRPAHRATPAAHWTGLVALTATEASQIRRGADQRRWLATR